MAKQVSKSQLIRLWDVFFLAPFLIWYALNTTGVSVFWRNIMIIAGILTAVYNGRNYLINEKIISRKRLAFLND